MELSHLIQSSQVENVRVCCPLTPPVTGTLCVSSHHLILSAHPVEGTKKEKCELWLLHCAVDSVEKSVQNIGMLRSKDEEGRSSSGTVTLKCKDLRVIHLEIPDMEETFNIARSVQALSSLDNISLRYPFFFRPAGCKLGKGWPRDTMENFYHKLKNETDAWRLSGVNENFKVCPSYPEKIIVPASCSDNNLKRAASFRQSRRFPVLSYYHPRSKTVLLRSAQPLVGPNHHSCEDDEMLLNAALMGQSRGFIIDIRTEQEAKQARSAGGGTENKDRYQKWSVLHRPLERGQALQSSLTRLVGTCYQTYLGRNHWLSKLQLSQWLSHIKEALSTAGLAAECIERERTCVLIHGDEGANNTLLVTSLAQLILSPDCRTMVGFQDLIEREWLQAGHPFQLRCARSGWAQGRFQQESPNFLLFLDCCWQLTRQFPMAMEFNEKLLCALATHAYSSEYGTFLCNNEKERYIYKVREKTHSLWGILNNFRQRNHLANRVYERNPIAIWPSVAPQSIQLWEGFFLRYLMPTEHKEMFWQRTWEIVGKNPY
ncbi:myotubularin-related protein 9-like [Phyllobates terribilis]|uniref:myotubularin-related protein 9-like n=1 Tax=Phyllobates terribilis TaxID=111132 RepID=UPI003CCB7182